MGEKEGKVRKNVTFFALMLGMLVAAASQTTIVSPAMPVIVADLGGIDRYSWVATSTLLVSAVTIPIVGKLADIYGRRAFFVCGLVVFIVASVLARTAQGFWWLVGARAVQGLGMGTIIPLSQTIIGDIKSARERGKYMGYLGAMFGVASVVPDNTLAIAQTPEMLFRLDAAFFGGRGAREEARQVLRSAHGGVGGGAARRDDKARARGGALGSRGVVVLRGGEARGRPRGGAQAGLRRGGRVGRPHPVGVFRLDDRRGPRGGRKTPA